MVLLSQEQMQRALEAMREYLASSAGGKPSGEAHQEIDEKRAKLIDSELGPLVRDYLDGKAALAGFKSTVDGINKRHTLWGFKGIKGQMFFNMVVPFAKW